MASPQLSRDSLPVQTSATISPSPSVKRSSESHRSITPAQAQMVLKAARHWRGQHEKKINSKIALIRDAKRSRDLKAESEIDALVARKVPFDLLAKDWLSKSNVSIEQRTYLLEKLVPTLVLAVEKLLIDVDKKGLVDTEKPSKDFNPINHIARYLMRNNPRYSNFAEASPYARGIRKLLEDLKKDAFNQEENKLAKMKLQAKKRKNERDKTEKFNFSFAKGRVGAIQELFVQWVENKDGAIFLHLVQSALRSFVDYMVNHTGDQANEMTYAINIGETDMTGKMLFMKDFVQMILEATTNFSEGLFMDFIKHMNHLSAEYRASEFLESIRLIWANLFLACDPGDTGLLDRKRVLKLLEAFYDNMNDNVTKASLRNPRKWPVIHIDEQEDADEELNEENFDSNDAAFEGRDEVGPKDTSIQADEKGNLVSENEESLEANAFEKQKETTTEEVEKDDHIVANTRLEDIKEKVEEHKEGEVARESKKGLRLSTSKDIERSSDHSEKRSPSKFVAVDVSEDMAREIERIIARSSTAMESSESGSKMTRAQSIATGSIFDPTTLNQAQFINVLEKFLGESPSKTIIEALVRYVRAGYIETEDERRSRLEKARLEARSAKRRLKLDQLFDLWDVDGSGYLELNEVQTVLSKWKEDESSKFKLAAHVFADTHEKIDRNSFKKYIQEIVDMYQEEDCFESLINFLFTRVERSFEERKRGEFRKKWLLAINNSAKTSGALLEPVLKTVYQALAKDAEIYGRNKKTAAYVAFLEKNDPAKSKHSGSNCLRYASCTPEDNQYVLNKVLYQDMKNVSFTVVNTGKPIHVPRVLHNGGVYLWNPSRKEEGIEGSLVMFPLKDHEKQIIGIFGVDTLPDPHEKSIFVTHEISFYQGLAKAISGAIQLIDSRCKTIKIAESAVSWILRRSQNVKEVNIYLVEPGLKTADGLVLRKMLTLRQGNDEIRYQIPPRLERKDNLFRDYLFKCIDTSETLTADAYGERHTAFPLRDGRGMVVAIVDISAGGQVELPAHENKEVHRMLKLLAMAHKEVAREIAGEEKNIVLSIEKEHQERRIDVLFDRIMLQDLRENVVKLDARTFAEIKSYIDPPKLVHDVVKAVLEIYFSGKEEKENDINLEEWSICKQFVNADLKNWMSTFDPTASSHRTIDGERLAASLSNVPPGDVAKQGSLPAQYLYKWVFVCLSLIEHTAKMKESRPANEVKEDPTDPAEDESNIAQEM